MTYFIGYESLVINIKLPNVCFKLIVSLFLYIFYTNRKSFRPHVHIVYTDTVLKSLLFSHN